MNSTRDDSNNTHSWLIYKGCVQDFRKCVSVYEVGWGGGGVGPPFKWKQGLTPERFFIIYIYIYIYIFFFFLGGGVRIIEILPPMCNICFWHIP